MTTESDDPKTLIGGLFGTAIPDIGPFSAKGAVRDIQRKIFSDDDDKKKKRKQRRLQSSSLTQGFADPLGGVGQRV